MADDTRSDRQARGGSTNDAGGVTNEGTRTERELARGRRSETPFMLVGGTALVVWAVAALIAAVVLLVWWVG